jgi:hypothetical protein
VGIDLEQGQAQRAWSVPRSKDLALDSMVRCGRDAYLVLTARRSLAGQGRSCSSTRAWARRGRWTSP